MTAVKEDAEKRKMTPEDFVVGERYYLDTDTWGPSEYKAKFAGILVEFVCWNSSGNLTFRIVQYRYKHLYHQREFTIFRRDIGGTKRAWTAPTTEEVSTTVTALHRILKENRESPIPHHQR